MAGVYPHKKGEKVYYVRRLTHTFSVKKLGEDGKPIQMTNPQSGLAIRTPAGELVYIEEMISFKKWHTKFSETGYCCVFVVDKNTPEHIAKEIEKDALDRKSEVMDEKTYIATVNPELAKHLEDEERVEKLLGSKDATIEQLRRDIQELQSRLGSVKK
jgi:hypothetical protein